MASDGVQFAREVVDVHVTEEMQDSFLAYSLATITSRAIPDVRDGLKPVQRRILYSMLDMGVRPDSNHKKSARIVGDVMGKYHPHGDAAIYEALVRLAQEFTMRVRLIDPKGNFGSLDDPPAAARYTECRLAPAAMEMVAELGEETVPFRANYDGEDSEPQYLPARMPNLLVNGSSGIAVGMATSIPPHNLREVVTALQLLIDRPDAKLSQVMKRLPAPDFPTGAVIVDDGGLRDAYRTGRGTFRIRATAEVVDVTARRRGIVITELPYLVGPERVIAKITELISSGKLEGISDVKDLSDRKKGLQIQLECKTGVDPQALLAELYRLTPLEETFGVNCVVLVDGRPRTMGLIELCQHYLEHRLDVIVRRSEYRLDKARDREHIVEGLLVALDNIDEVVRIIRASDDSAQARDRLVEAFDLTEIQAQHILDMQLRRLTGLEVTKLRDELEDLRVRIAELTELLADEQLRRAVLADELQAVADTHGDDRRSRILSADEVIIESPGSLEVADDPCEITLSTSGLVGMTGEPSAQRKLGRHDVLSAVAHTTARNLLWAVTTAGRALAVEAVEVPQVAGRSRGAAASEIFDLARGEKLVGMYGALDASDGQLLVLVTAGGVVKRLRPEEVTSSTSAGQVVSLKGEDSLVAAFGASESAEIAMIASDGQVLRMSASSVRPQGRAAAGMTGMKLRGGAEIVAAHPISDDDLVVTWTDAGAVKATSAADFPAKGRATGGVRAMRFRSGESRVAGAHVGQGQGLVAVVGAGEGLFAEADPTPEPLEVKPTRRDGTGSPMERPVLHVGRSR